MAKLSGALATNKEGIAWGKAALGTLILAAAAWCWNTDRQVQRIQTQLDYQQTTLNEIKAKLP